jgi:hypothetical protein
MELQDAICGRGNPGKKKAAKGGWRSGPGQLASGTEI